MTERSAGRDIERLTMGIVAAAMLAAGGISLITSDPDQGWEGIAIRSGVVLGAIWLALPNLRRTPRRVRLALGVLAGTVLVRPQLLLWAVPVALLVLVFAGRRRS